MHVEVKLYAILRRYRPDSVGGALHHPFFVTLPDGETVSYLINNLGIPDGLVQAAAVNDDAVGIDARLHDGDRVKLFPMAAGG